MNDSPEIKVPPLGRDNYREWLAAMRTAYEEVLVDELFVGRVLVDSGGERQEILDIRPHQDLTGRPIRNWVSVTTRDTAGHQAVTGYWQKATVFVPHRRIQGRQA